MINNIKIFSKDAFEVIDDLKMINIFTGANGIGKTRILKDIYYTCENSVFMTGYQSAKTFIDNINYERSGLILIIDEIENGLHYSAMNTFWTNMLDKCRNFNIQLFFSTHSYEIISSLVQNISPNNKNDQIKLIRLVKGGAIVSDQQEVLIKIERGIEMR